MSTNSDIIVLEIAYQSNSGTIVCDSISIFNKETFLAKIFNVMNFMLKPFEYIIFSRPLTSGKLGQGFLSKYKVFKVT